MADDILKRHTNLVRQIKCANIFSSEECQNIINSANSFPQVLAELEGNFINTKIRETKVRYLDMTDETSWIWNRINRCIIQTNQQFYNFDIEGLSELQLLEYGEGCFYDWHVDITAQPDTCTRKISIIVFLSDKNDYEGGMVKWDLRSTYDVKYSPMEQGSMILFPSYQAHKVEPVMKGKRFTLVGWAHGNVFS